VGDVSLIIRNGHVVEEYFNDRNEATDAVGGLSIELIIPADSSIRLNDLLEGKLCLQINGYSCYCFPSSYGDLTKVTVPQQCLPKHKLWTILWFSIQLRLDEINNQTENGTKQRTINSLGVLVRNEDQLWADDCAASDTTAEGDLSGAKRRPNGDESEEVNTGPAQLSLVLPLAVDDLSRSLILLNSLKQVPTDTVLELLIFVPDDHLLLLKKPIDGMMASGFNFSTSVYSEQVLFRRPFGQYANTAYPYALQMAIKLLAAQLVRTPFYITLDADVILLHPFTTTMLLSEHKLEMPFSSFTFGGGDGVIHSHSTISSSLEGRRATHFRAAYHYEDRSVHYNWWVGSETLLGVGPTEREGQQIGFGVTPAILSTFGSLSTVAKICSNLEEHWTEFDARLQTTAECEERWLDGLGIPGSLSGLWSEYTAYRLALQDLEVNPLQQMLTTTAHHILCAITSCSTCYTWARCRWATHIPSCTATTSGTPISYRGTRRQHSLTRAACSQWSSLALAYRRGLSTDSTCRTVGDDLSVCGHTKVSDDIFTIVWPHKMNTLIRGVSYAPVSGDGSNS